MSRPPDATVPASATGSPARLAALARDPWVAAVVGAAALFFLLLWLPLAPGARALLTDRGAPLLFLALTAGAIHQRVGDLATRRERRFWHGLGLAPLFWLAVLLLYLPFPVERPLWVNLTADLLYVAFYLALLLPVELQPDRHSARRLLDTSAALAWPATTLFVLGLLLYFVLIPGAVNRQAYATLLPSMYLFLALDAYLTGRLLQLALTSAAPRWRTTYLLLAAATAGFLINDLIEALLWAGVPPWRPGTPADVHWILPFVPLVVAARSRHLSFPARGKAGRRKAPDRERATLPPPLFAFVLALPLLHLGLYFFAALDEGSRRPRAALVLLWSGILAVLATAQQSLLRRRATLLVRRSRRAEDALRRREESLRHLTGHLDPEEALHLSEELFVKAFRSSPDPMLVTRIRDGRILAVNDSFERVTGFARHEAVGRSTLELGVWQGEEDRHELVRRVREGGQVRGFERPMRIKSGEVRRFRLSSERIEIAGEGSILSVAHDVTEETRTRERERALEEQLLRAQRLESIGTLAGGIAHDLNNVLAPILMAIQLLERSAQDDRSRQVLGILESNTRRASRMVKQVLTFARGVEGERLEVPVARLLRDVERFVDNTFPKSIELTCEAPRRPWSVEGDATQLHQVLLNLCVNGRDAMPLGGRLRIAAESLQLRDGEPPLAPGARPGPYVLLRVEDTGEGIPEEHLPKIFDPFFTTKPLGHGTGLGLSTALAIVRSHGGFLTVDSELGRGTTFRVYLPACVGPRDARRAGASGAPPTGRGERVLVVDDEAPVRELTRRVLEEHGYRVLTAADGDQALARLRDAGTAIDAVILDLVLPARSGIQTIAAIAALEPALPILAASGLPSPAELDRYPSVKAFLAKPFPAATLLETLYRVLREKREATP